MLRRLSPIYSDGALRAFACALGTSALALLALIGLSLTTTDGYGCETDCTAYERALIDTAPILSLSTIALAVATVALAAKPLLHGRPAPR